MKKLKEKMNLANQLYSAQEENERKFDCHKKFLAVKFVDGCWENFDFDKTEFEVDETKFDDFTKLEEAKAVANENLSAAWEEWQYEASQPPCICLYGFDSPKEIFELILKIEEQ